MPTKLIVGTSKGLIIFENTDHEWKIISVQFEGLPVSLVYVDERSNIWWVGISHRHWGEKLHFSKDKGKSWQEAAVPNFANYFYRPKQPTSLKKIWVMQHAGNDQPDCLWLGTEPGGLFFSANNGLSWQLNESLWNNPSRLDDQQWFGAGKDFPFIHSIVVDTRNSDYIYIGVSCAGVFKSEDGGKSWQAKNNGLIAAYLPNPKSEMGHDPHRVLQCASNPNVIWQQNHCGIFRSTNGGENWSDVSGANGFPKYGFALAIDDNDPNAAWVIPAQSDDMRIPLDLRLTVSRTLDGGEHWVSKNNGLPDFCSFDIVLRHAFVKQKDMFAFGSNNGNLYLSENRGESWKIISQHLASINYLALSQ